MAGFSTYTKRHSCGEGVMIYKDEKEVFLDKIEAGMLAKHIQHARVNYWDKFRLPTMKPLPLPRCSICDSEEKLHQCHGCEEWFCEKHIEYGPDPCNYDVGNDDTPVWECSKCRTESANDI